MIERILRVKNFRNIGNEDFETLDLNIALKPKEQLGGLVTLIGMNNTGKSNYLDALMYLKSKSIRDSDRPFFLYDDSEPTIVSLWLRDTANKHQYEYTVKKNQVYVEEYDEHNNKIDYGTDKLQTPNHFELMEPLKDKDVFKEILKDYSSTNPTSFFNLIERGENNELTSNDITLLNKLFRDSSFKRKIVTRYRLLSDNNFQKLSHSILDAFNLIKDKNQDALKVNKIKEKLNDEYNLKLIPNIIKYEDKLEISSKNTSSQILDGKLKNPDFFKLLFSYLNNVNYSELEAAYDKFQKSNRQKHFLTNFQKKVNDALEELSTSFNRIYGYRNNNNYEFRLDLESNNVYFIISENNTDVPIENQSTGFNWFFNFFFKVFANNQLENGDIIILDEPATNLHVIGQIELRKQLKEFGLQNGITFIISTHSPFLIDIDYLDDLRIVYKENQISKIQNKFTVGNGHNADALLPINSALSVDRHIIENPKNTTIFVEGITDYNYLVAFKNLLKIDNLNFIPFQGLRNKTLINQLLNITNNPVVLVDSDNEGKKFASIAESYNEVEVHKLEDYNDDVKVIEDLFDDKDRDKFYLDDKSYKASSYFKNNIESLKKQLSKGSKDSFHKLLTSIEI
ncbi:MAG: AAA family ATPase [bacterium]